MKFYAPLKSDSIKVMLLGSGELGKEVAIEAQRLGLEVVAVDSYNNAPAHLVANRSYVVNMKDKSELLDVIKRENPTYILPEIEAINIDALLEAEESGFNVIPNAKAVHKTMNRKNIREFAAKDLGLKTSAYRFVKSLKALKSAAKEIGFPCVIKPVMSSSGYGQSVARSFEDLDNSWEIAKNARGDASELIVEEFVEFDYEITLLTIRNGKDTTFCEPIGHIQKDGDYIFSWQPMKMSSKAKSRAKDIAKRITNGLGGKGLFGVELFVKGDEVYFSEVSPRPHDTGMVTLITQSQSEFALHIRAILGLPIDFVTYGAGASAAYKYSGDSSSNPFVKIKDSAFSKDSFVRVFGKPTAHNGRRVAVALSFDKSSPKKALKKAKKSIKSFSN
jgi:phosphoribosylglycinamide formyltransferase 2